MVVYVVIAIIMGPVTKGQGREGGGGRSDLGSRHRRHALRNSCYLLDHGN